MARKRTMKMWRNFSSFYSFLEASSKQRDAPIWTIDLFPKSQINGWEEMQPLAVPSNVSKFKSIFWKCTKILNVSETTVILDKMTFRVLWYSNSTPCISTTKDLKLLQHASKFGELMSCLDSLLSSNSDLNVYYIRHFSWVPPSLTRLYISKEKNHIY